MGDRYDCDSSRHDYDWSHKRYFEWESCACRKSIPRYSEKLQVMSKPGCQSAKHEKGKDQTGLSEEPAQYIAHTQTDNKEATGGYEYE